MSVPWWNVLTPVIGCILQPYFEVTVPPFTGHNHPLPKALSKLLYPLRSPVPPEEPHPSGSHPSPLFSVTVPEIPPDVFINPIGLISTSLLKYKLHS